MGIGAVTGVAIAMAIASFAARLRFPSVPKQLASAGLFGALSYLAWSVCPTKDQHSWWVPAGVVLMSALAAGLIDWKLNVCRAGSPLRVKPKRPTRDVPLQEAYAFVTLHEWGKNVHDVSATELQEIATPLRKIEQLALDGDLIIWGKERSNSLYELIHKRYWRDHQVEWFSLVRGDPRTEKSNFGASDVVYNDLMACKEQFEYHFPPE